MVLVTAPTLAALLPLVANLYAGVEKVALETDDPAFWFVSSPGGKIYAGVRIVRRGDVFSLERAEPPRHAPPDLVAEVSTLARETFGAWGALEWLGTPHRLLGGNRPCDDPAAALPLLRSIPA